MTLAMSHKSWDTVRYSTAGSEELEVPITMSKEVFDDCQNCLKSLQDCLWQLKDAVFYTRIEDVIAGNYLYDMAYPHPKETRLETATRLFKDQLQVFHRIEGNLLVELSANEYHHVDSKASRPRRTPSANTAPSRADCYRASINDDVTFEEPREVPRPREVAIPQRCSSRLNSFTLEAKSPVPERNPSRRVSEIHTTTGSVRLFNTPPGFFTNLLPEEHVARAKKRECSRRNGTSGHDTEIRGGLMKTSEDSQPSTSSSSNTSFSNTSSSLRLSAVVEGPSSQTCPDTGSLRQISRSRRGPRAKIQHSQVPSGSTMSTAFYTPEHRSTPRAQSHLPTDARTDSGMFVGSPITTDPVISRKASSPSITSKLKASQVALAREKLIREVALKTHQVEEANRMLRELSQVEALQEGWVSTGRVPIDEGHQREEVSIGKKIRSLWRNGTKKATRMQAVRV